MTDVYTRVSEAAPKILEGLVTALELRAADPQQRAMLTIYLNDAALPSGARVLEVGCGAGSSCTIARTREGRARWRLSRASSKRCGSRDVLTRPSAFIGTKNLFASLESAGEKLTFGIDPSRLPAFLAERGLSLESDLGAAEYRALLRRRGPHDARA